MRYLGTYIWVPLMFLSVLTGCVKEDRVDEDSPYYVDLPKGFPTLPVPADNQLTVKRIELGKMLFFDKNLSVDSTVSCASCHFQQFAFSDDKALSTGVEGRTGFRNSPPLFNLAYHPYFFKDGGVPTIELQVLAPIQDVNEMAHDIPELIELIKDDQEYQKLAMIAYGRSFDPFVLTRAIAAFERTLISGNSPYDEYQFQNNSNALSASEIRGLELFSSERLACSNCHSGFNFTDYAFKNNGLYETYPSDSGRMRITLNPQDEGKFKTPSLRNVGITAPYMFDGSLQTLEAVVEHYNSGGSSHPIKDPLIKPLNLTQQEKNDLIAFLNALTDQTFITDPKFLP